MNRTPAPQTAQLSEDEVRGVIDLAVQAPSIHNTQPWWFGTGDHGHGPLISVHSDADRKLNVADPDGREMLISCGAALFTVRLALQHLGYEPQVTLLPDPDRPALLADVRLGPPAHTTLEIRRLYGEIRRRRSHRGAFLDRPVGAHLLAALTGEVQQEGARLAVAVSQDRVALAALTQAATQVQRMDPAYIAEEARWAPAPGSRRQDGVHEHAYPRSPERTEPHFPARDFARGQGWGADCGVGESGVTGTVLILTTAGDERADWLAAGQALQRMLLRASVAHMSAAFHTQAVEVPELREFIRTRFCRGAYPQLVLRLGSAPGELGTVRRPAEQVTNEEYA